MTTHAPIGTSRNLRPKTTHNVHSRTGVDRKTAPVAEALVIAPTVPRWSLLALSVPQLCLLEECAAFDFG